MIELNERLSDCELEQIAGGLSCEVQKALSDVYMAAGHVMRVTGQTGAASDFYWKSATSQTTCVTYGQH